MTEPSTEVLLDEQGDLEISMVILRACKACGGPTALKDNKAWCFQCDLPSVTHDLGTVNARYKNPIKNFIFQKIRRPLADRRIRQANKTVES